jgi:excisionase family DNA binding protein
MNKYRTEKAIENPLTLSIGEASTMLGVSSYLVRRLVDEGKLPSVRLGRLVRIPRIRLLSMLGGDDDIDPAEQVLSSLDEPD